MAQPSMPLGAWDGWVLYTAESGHKYHWNHLTHESRWAVDEASSRNNNAEVRIQPLAASREYVAHEYEYIYGKHNTAARLDTMRFSVTRAMFRPAYACPSVIPMIIIVMSRTRIAACAAR